MKKLDTSIWKKNRVQLKWCEDMIIITLSKYIIIFAFFNRNK